MKFFEIFLYAISLIMIFEGLIYFIYPKATKDIYSFIEKLADDQLRQLGLSFIVSGFILATLLKFLIFK